MHFLFCFSANVGFVSSNYTVNESLGNLEVCVWSNGSGFSATVTSGMYVVMCDHNMYSAI